MKATWKRSDRRPGANVWTDRRSALPIWALAAALAACVAAVGSPAAADGKARLLKGQQGSVQTLVFSPDGKRLLSAGMLQTRLWDLGTGRAAWSVDGSGQMGLPGENARPSFSPDGKWIVLSDPMMDFSSVDGDSFLPLVHTATGRALHKVPLGHSLGSVGAIAVSPDGKMLATAPMGTPPTVWDVKTGRPRVALGGKPRMAFGLAFSPDGKTLAAPGSDFVMNPGPAALQAQAAGPTTVLWDTATGKRIGEIPGGGDHSPGVAFSPDGKRLVVPVPVPYFSVAIHEMPSGKLLRTLKQIGNDLLVFTPDGKKLVTCTHRGSSHVSVAVADLETGEAQGTVSREKRGYAEMGDAVAMDAGAAVLAMLDGPNVVAVFRTLTGEQLATLRGGSQTRFQCVGVSPDGSLVAAGAADGTVYLWDVPESPAGPAEAEPGATVAREGPSAEGAAQEPDRPWRTWTSANGKYTIEARLVAEHGDTVKLRNKSGEDVEVPLAKLSPEDREYVSGLRDKPSQAPSPGGAKSPGEPERPAAAVAQPGTIQRPAGTPKVWAFNQMPYNGKLLVDMTGVTILFEDIPMGASYAYGQIQVAGPEMMGPGEGVSQDGRRRLTEQTSYVDGVAKIVLRTGRQEHTLEVHDAGAKLVVGDQEFDLTGEKKTLVIDGRGKVRESAKPIKPPASPMGPTGPMPPMQGPGAPR